LVLASIVLESALTQLALPDSRGQHGFYMEIGKTYGEIPALLAPISESDLERWAWMMELDEAQAAQMRVLHQAYLEREEIMHLEHVQPLWDASAEILGPIPNTAGMAVAEAHAALVRKPRSDALKAQRRVDNEFFAQLALLLRDTQAPGLQRIRLERERSWAVRTTYGFPGSHLDLTLWLFELHRGGTELPSDEAWTGHWDQYAATFSALCRSREEALVRVFDRGVVLYAERFSGLGQADALFNQERGLRRALIDIERRIHDLNVSQIDLTWLNHSRLVAERLRDRFRQASYPPAYPDATDPRDVLADAASVPSLTDEQRSKIEWLGEAVLAQRDAATQGIVREFLAWREEWGVEKRAQNILVPKYASRVEPLHRQRMALTDLALMTLESVLTSEQIESLEARIASLRKAMSDPFIPDPSFPNIPPPPPRPARQVVVPEE
jgi:hypothetical protein